MPLFIRPLCLPSDVLAALELSALQDLASGSAAHAVEKPVTPLLHQPRVPIHGISRAAAHLHRAGQARVRRDGSCRDNVGDGSFSGCRGRGEERGEERRRSADGQRCEGRSDGR